MAVIATWLADAPKAKAAKREVKVAAHERRMSQLEKDLVNEARARKREAEEERQRLLVAEATAREEEMLLARQAEKVENDKKEEERRRQ